MARIQRAGDPGECHRHQCPECKRLFDCGCKDAKSKSELLCCDCEDRPGWSKVKEEN